MQVDLDGLAANIKDAIAGPRRQEWCFMVDQLVQHVNSLESRHSDIVGELYGQGYRVLGFHLNGDEEPLDSWFEENDWIGEPRPPVRGTVLPDGQPYPA